MPVGEFINGSRYSFLGCPPTTYKEVKMAKPIMVTVTRSLIQAVQDLTTSPQWTQLPLPLRERIERGLKGKD